MFALIGEVGLVRPQYLANRVPRDMQFAADLLHRPTLHMEGTSNTRNGIHSLQLPLHPLSKAGWSDEIQGGSKLDADYPAKGVNFACRNTVKMGRRTYGEVVGLIIDGTIKSVIRDARHNGTFRFDNIFVDPAEVKGASPISAPPGITIQLAERELGTTRTTVEQLVASGILKSVSAENPATGKRQTFVVPSGLEDFRATYISLFDYSKGRDQIGSVKKKLTAAGIMPAFEKAGAATFYRRDALPAAWD
ncbi:hypothetical protein [Rhizobium sp. HT1-10]|uniref:hypothetical protein n=1 Tax=Rhizobium sp. HT1-10 TaxID=3111638 RepID=UPI003C20CA42